MEMGAAAAGDDHPNIIGEEAEEVVLPGFRFHPTDQELVGFYLRRKVEKRPICIDLIKQIDIYKYNPWDLPRVSNSGDKEWYFFCLRGRKYRNSVRPNRVTLSGFWKATGIDRPVFSMASPSGTSHDCIGLKKSLVYYRGSAGKGSKTDWMMHEFRLPTSGKNAPVAADGSCIPEAESWTICRIFRRAAPCNKQGHGPNRPQHVPVEPNSSTGTCATLGYWKCASAITCGVTKDARSTSNRSVFTHHIDADDESNNTVATSYLGAGNFDGRMLRSMEQCHIPTTQTCVPWLADTTDQCAADHIRSPSPSPCEFDFDQGSWDELGRLVEFAADPSPLPNEYCGSY